MLNREHRYEDGPTVCMAAPAVVKNIQKLIKQTKSLSMMDIRLATNMGLTGLSQFHSVGFNDGTFYPPTDPQLNMSPQNALARVSSTASGGKMHALALLVDFADNVGTRPPAEFQKLLFDAANPNSLTSYYDHISGGTLKVDGLVTPYLRMPQNYGYYTNGESGTGSSFPNNTPGLLVDALTAFTKTDSLAPFDLDGDGYVDGVFLIHAGSGAEAEPDKAKRPNMIWSHKWVLPTPFAANGVKVYAYSTEPEDGKVGVFTHEFGHVLGLPDLYDTSYRSSGVGDWCLMGGGSWGGGGNKPVRMCAWCLSRLGWIKPTNIAPTPGKALVIPPLENDPKACYRLSKNGKPGPEYFLIENRQPIGLDTAIPGSGLAVWHIDETQSDNSNSVRYMVGLVQADGKRDLEFNANRGDDGDPFPGTSSAASLTPTTNPSTNANDNSPTGISLTQIKIAGSDVKLKVKL